MSPPISFGYGDEGFIDDWAIVKAYPSMIGKLNFVRNIINLGSIVVDQLTAWMDPHQSSFNYSGNRLYFSCLILDEEMFKPDPKTNLCHNNITVMKNGSASNLTIGCLNTIQAFMTQRTYSIVGQPGKMLKELCFAA